MRAAPLPDPEPPSIQTTQTTQASAQGDPITLRLHQFLPGDVCNGAETCDGAGACC
jgi:hypothetical protein